MSKKRALITGITGQDGSYLAEILLEKGYEVHGIRRRLSSSNIWRIEHLLSSNEHDNKITLHSGDLTDTGSLARVFDLVQPDEVYNLAAQSHVGVSFDEPEFTANSDAIGPLRLLEIIRARGLSESVRFYQASTSELFGQVKEVPQTESTPFYPRSPYGVAKLFAYWITVNYREAYGIYACNGILFNHESPRRGEEFVTRKITMALSNIHYGKQDVLLLGNLDAKRDWGHARDYAEMQWLMLQQDKPKDYVIATGEQHSVREFVERAARFIDRKIEWVGDAENEIGIDQHGKILIKVHPQFYRPAEVETLLGDASLAKKELNWMPTTSFDKLVEEMMLSDLKRAKDK